MQLTRRQALALGAGGAALVLAGGVGSAMASVDEAIGKFTGGASASDGGIDLTAPEIAENGNTVPVAVEVPGAVAISLFAAGNPRPEVATFKFGPLSGAQRASTRIRLAKTQDVIAVAQMADGSFRKQSATIKVTIGGCGG